MKASVAVSLVSVFERIVGLDTRRPEDRTVASWSTIAAPTAEKTIQWRFPRDLPRLTMFMGLT